MFTTDKNILKTVTSEKRVWQGIPSIEMSAGGRIFVCFYSGGVHEQIGNYVVLLQSDDGGKTFGEPIAAIMPEKETRCFDPALWRDPFNRLWLTWARAPEDTVFAVICGDPDAQTLSFSEEFPIGAGVMMNKPTVLSTGEWLFPLAVWNEKVRAPHPRKPPENPGAYVYVTYDCGRSFRRLGHVNMPTPSYDEHMVLEQANGSLTMYLRTKVGIGTAHSYDGGQTWINGSPKTLNGPCSRFHIRRLPSGRILLVNHVDFTGRNNLTALLSEDDGKTWKYRLLLDERNSVSYPDVAVAPDGSLYIVYDRERGGYQQKLSDALACAREILLARITEDDIIAGTPVSSSSFFKRIVSKLDVYKGEDPNPFDELERYTAPTLAAYLAANVPKDEIVSKVFELHPVRCEEEHFNDQKRIDDLIDGFLRGKTVDTAALIRLITELRMFSGDHYTDNRLTASVISYINAHPDAELTQESLAKRFYVSKYYFAHVFKRETGLSVIQFCVERRIAHAKWLLMSGNEKVSCISEKCGFGSYSYFSKVFKNKTGMTPIEYRRHTNQL